MRTVVLIHNLLVVWSLSSATHTTANCTPVCDVQLTLWAYECHKCFAEPLVVHSPMESYKRIWYQFISPHTNKQSRNLAVVNAHTWLLQLFLLFGQQEDYLMKFLCRCGCETRLPLVGLVCCQLWSHSLPCPKEESKWYVVHDPL